MASQEEEEEEEEEEMKMEMKMVEAIETRRWKTGDGDALRGPRTLLLTNAARSPSSLITVN